MHVGEVKLLLSLILELRGIFRLEEIVQCPFLAPLAIFLGSHHHRSVEIRVSYLRTYIIYVERVVIHHLLLDIIRHGEVERRTAEVALAIGNCLLDFPSCMKEGIRNSIIS